MRRAWLEVEETAGRLWHRWASAAGSWPGFPAAAARFAELEGTLGVFFRALGGDPGVQVAAHAESASAHRLTLRQRLGADHERLALACLDEEALLLPAQLAFFPEPALNRQHYFWLVAHGASLAEAPLPMDPLQRDLARLALAQTASKRACDRLPGLRTHRRSLERALRAARPPRRLPPAEAAMEVLILEALGASAAEQSLSAAAHTWLARYRRALAGQGPLPTAPKGYRPPLPVPLWTLPATHRSAGQRCSPPPSESFDASEDAADAGRTRRRARRRRQDQAEREDPLVFNRFEKILSMAEMVNVNRLVDDEPDPHAARHAEEFDELTLAPHQQRAATRLQAELDLPREEVIGEPTRGNFTYPEWHYRARRYLPDHCMVFTAPQTEASRDRWQPDLATRRRIRRVRRQFETLRPARMHERNQPDGELDLDAIVRTLADRRAGGPGSDHVHRALRERGRDLAVTVLVDLSMSTEAWLEDRRVIDVEKEAVLVLAHGIAACGDSLAIHGFTSRRREAVHVHRLKDWREPVDGLLERRIGALCPGSYTRMGAALRHVTRDLARRPERHRLLLLLTDGKPNDTDYYEGRYAIEDTRRAVLDARQLGVRVFAVTIDREARAYLPRIFGISGYRIVQRPQALASALPMIYRALVRP